MAGLVPAISFRLFLVDRVVRDGSGVFVRHVVPGSPAADAGLLADDRILSVDGSPVDNQSLVGIRQVLRGPAGDTVRILVARSHRTLAFQVPLRPLF